MLCFPLTPPCCHVRSPHSLAVMSFRLLWCPLRARVWIAFVFANQLASQRPHWKVTKMKVGDWKPCCVFRILRKALAYEINSMDNSKPIKGAENIK